MGFRYSCNVADKSLTERTVRIPSTHYNRKSYNDEHPENYARIATFARPIN